MISHKTYFEEVGIWPKRSKGVIGDYLFGGVLAVLLTLAAYAVATRSLFTPSLSVALVILLILLQFLVQVRYFLHIRWNTAGTERLLSLAYAMLIVSILLIGSLWIMQNLSTRMMPSPEQMNAYMKRNPGL